MRGIPFDLTEAAFKELAALPCHYCGAEPTRTFHGRYNGPFVYNGVDRLNNDGGYSVENCVSCCWTCNRAKQCMSKSDFIAWVERIHACHPLP